MNERLVTIFGGAGFIGKYVVRKFVKQGWRVRVAMRRPHTGLELKVIGNVGQVQLVQANLRYEDSVARAVAGSDAVVNLVALLYESGAQSFENIHIDGAETLARAVAEAGIETSYMSRRSVRISTRTVATAKPRAKVKSAFVNLYSAPTLCARLLFSGLKTTSLTALGTWPACYPYCPSWAEAKPNFNPSMSAM